MLKLQILFPNRKPKQYLESVDIVKDKWIHYVFDEEQNLYIGEIVHKNDVINDGDVYIVRPYTGQKDSTGREVYLGDEIESHSERWLVLYDEEYSAFCLKSMKTDKRLYTNNFRDYVESGRVIDHIYDYDITDLNEKELPRRKNDEN